DHLAADGDVEERVALRIVHAHYLRIFEEYRRALAEHALLARQLVGQRDGTDLPAGDREARWVLGEAERARDAARARLADVARHAGHVRIVEGIDTDPVVGAEHVKGGRRAADLLGRGAGGEEQQRECDEDTHGSSGRGYERYWTTAGIIH